MKPEAQRYERIQRYLLGQGSEAERSRFEADMRADPALAEEVERHRAVHAVVEEAALADFRERVRRHHAERGGPPRPVRLSRWAWSLGALLLIMTAGVWLFPDGEEEPPVQSPETQAAPFANPEEERATSEEAVPQQLSAAPTAQAETLRKTVPAQEPASSETAPAIAKAVEPSPKPVAKQGPEPTPSAPRRLSSASVSDLPGNALAEPPSLALNEDRCADFSPEVSYETESACAGSKGGTLNVVSAEGGQSPWRYSVDSGKSWRAGDEFTGLAPGQYELLAMDANDCVAQAGAFEIDERECGDEDIAFNPDRGERWTLPKSAQAFSLKVVDRAGRTVYRSDFAAGEVAEWAGTARNGSRLPTGAYLYVIAYADGASRKGTVTLTR